MYQSSTLETRLRRSEASLIPAPPTLGSWIKRPLLEKMGKKLWSSTVMMRQLHQLTRKLIRELLLCLDLEHSWDILLLTTSDLALVMGLSLVDKSILKTKSSVMLRSKEQFLEETTSKPSLVWPIQNLQSQVLSQFLMRWWTKSFWKVMSSPSISLPSSRRQLEWSPTWLLVTTINKSI